MIYAKGIKITEDILKEYHFIKDRKEIYCIKCGEYSLEVSKNTFSSDKWFVSINTGYGNQPVTLIKKYIHQIQNLFFDISETELVK